MMAAIEEYPRARRHMTDAARSLCFPHRFGKNKKRWLEMDVLAAAGN
jgi:hypothetical protein